MAEQRQTSRAEAIEVLGGQRELTAMPGDVLSAGRRLSRLRRRSKFRCRRQVRRAAAGGLRAAEGDLRPYPCCDRSGHYWIRFQAKDPRWRAKI